MLKISSMDDFNTYKVCIYMVKNPTASIKNGPTAEEAENILKTKFELTDSEIYNLKFGK